jgi:hypothetical protein
MLKMNVILNLAKAAFLAMTLVELASAESTDPMDGHFTSWDEVPSLIDSISVNSYRDQLDKLHQLTRIKLGYPQSSLCLNDDEHQQYMLQTKQRWIRWWESTGKSVSILKKKDATIDRQAFLMAWEFLGTKQKQPEHVIPVWIPTAWTLYVTYTNGDYMGREQELWIINRQAESASLSKIRGDYSQGVWSVALTEYGDFSPERANQLLKALCYLNRYAPVAGEEVTDDVLPGLYYPHSTLHLRDDTNRILWNTEGYDFHKTRPEYGDGESGRSYYFLRTVFSDKGKWKTVAKPTSEALAPYRMFLSFSKPYFSSTVSDVVQLFGQHGGSPENQAMLEWAEKQKAATDPKMTWEACSADFGAESKVNVINFTRSAIVETMQEIKKVADRLETKPASGGGTFDAERAKERELERYIVAMFALEKKEEKDAIQRYPQPLRDLIIADEHPDDPDLKHLSAAVQAVRNAPDPKLFAQLVEELHEGTLKIHSLLNHILLNENDILDLKAWGAKEEAIALSACIDSLPLAKDSAKDDLVETLLRVCGGGKIEIEGANGGRSIEIVPTKSGYQMTLGGASNPLSIELAQRELRLLYKKSRAQQDGGGHPATRSESK